MKTSTDSIIISNTYPDGIAYETKLHRNSSATKKKVFVIFLHQQ